MAEGGCRWGEIIGRKKVIFVEKMLIKLFCTIGNK